MICPTCRGTGTIKCFWVDETKLDRWLPIVSVPCPDCIGPAMICQNCHGNGVLPIRNDQGKKVGIRVCHDCIGGVASCCDTAGENFGHDVSEKQSGWSSPEEAPPG